MYERLETVMQERGVKAADICKATGLRSSMFSDWKMGRAVPKHDKIKKIAEYLHVNPDYLTGESDDPAEGGPKGYYVNAETLAAAQEIFDNPDLRILFAAAKDAKPEDLRLAADLLRRFRGEYRT